jgi:hypothetical protein
MLDSTDPRSCIRYRIAYGEAARLIEMATYDHAWGRDFAARRLLRGGIHWPSQRRAD